MSRRQSLVGLGMTCLLVGVGAILLGLVSRKPASANPPCEQALVPVYVFSQSPELAVALGEDWNPASMRLDNQSYQNDLARGVGVKEAIERNARGSNSTRFRIDCEAWSASLAGCQLMKLPVEALQPVTTAHVKLTIDAKDDLSYQIGGDGPSGDELFLLGGITNDSKGIGLAEQLASETTGLPDAVPQPIDPTLVVERSPGASSVIFRFLGEPFDAETYVRTWVAYESASGQFEVFPMDLPTAFLK